MRWLPASLLALVLAACAQDPLPPPTLVSVEPARAPLDSSRRLMLQLDALLPFTLHYGQGTAAPREELQAWVGTQQLEGVYYAGEGRFFGELRPGLELGSYDVRAQLADGREASLSSAFTVVAPDNTNPNDFRVDVHGTRFYKSVAFPMTIYAPGPEAWRFNGTVSLRSSVGNITPSVTEPFSNGVTTVKSVTIDTAAAGVIIYVEDQQGRRGQSAPFNIEER